MNKIYKLVWSKVRSAWVVTSEIAKGHGKDSSSGRNRSMLKAGVVMALLGGFMTAGISPVAAELTQDQKAVYDAVMKEMNQDNAVKYYGVNENVYPDVQLNWAQLVIYDSKKALDADLPDKNIHGEGSQENKGNGSKSANYGSMAAGYNAYTSHGFSTALGNETVAYTNSLAAGFASYARAGSVALGVNAFAKDRSEAIGQYARADQEAIAIGYKATAGGFNRGEQTDTIPQAMTGIAIGKEAYAKGGMAFGNGAESLSLNAMAFGVRAKAIGSGVALGYQAQANVSGGIAIGMNSRAEVGRNVKGYLAPDDIDGKDAAEKRTWISGGSAVSFGNIKLARQLTNVAAGTEDTDAVNIAQLKALNTKVDNGAIHYFHVNSDDKNAPEGTNYNNDGATGKDAIAIGKNAVSEGPGSIAIGKGSKVFNTNTSLGMAIGDGAEAAHGSIVIGKNARDYDTDPKNGAFGVYIGLQAKSLGGSAQTVIGNYGQAKGEDSTAIGTSAQALGIESLAVGSSAKSLAKGAASFGTDSIAEFDESTALGSYANGRGNKSVASGNKSVAAGHNSVAIGYQTFAHNGFIGEDEYKALSPEEQNKYFKASGINAYFLKDEADGNDAEKIGDTYLNTAVGSYSRAYKHGTTLGGMTSAKEEGTAVGTYAKAYKKGAASLGYKAKANVENGVALGAYSVANVSKGIAGWDPMTGEASTDETLVWKSTRGAVSVGDNNNSTKFTRQIVNVAAGSEDTDAVNVAQLKAVNNKADKLDKRISEEKAHYFSVSGVSRDVRSNYHNNATNGVEKSLAIGEYVVANDYSVAIGYRAKNNFDTEYKNGRPVKRTHYYSMALLKDRVGSPRFEGEWAYEKIRGSHTIAIGDRANTNDTMGIAIGYKASAGKLGTNNAVAPQIAVGALAEASGYSTIAVGEGATAEMDSSIAIGTGAYAKPTGSEDIHSIAFGTYSRSEATESMAFGHHAKALANRSIAFGAGSEAKVSSGVALGYSSVADRKESLRPYLAGEGKVSATVYGTLGAVSIGNPYEDRSYDNIKVGWYAEKGTRQLTNLAAGSEDSDAVNVAQLKVVNAKADKNAEAITNLTNTVTANGKATKVTVDGNENSQDGNLKIKKTDANGQLTYDLSLNDEITIGKAGQDGKDGKIGINGKDGRSADITIGKGKDGVDGKAGEDGITRIIYQDEKGETRQVATLDDGLKFKGDNDTVVTRKLNEQLAITGGITNEAELSNNNIGVVGTAGDKGGMEVKLSKKLKDLTSAEFKDGDNVTNITAGNVTVTRKEGNETNTVDLWELNQTVNKITTGTTDVSSWKLQANGKDERTITKGGIVNFTNGTATKVTVKDNDVTVDLNDATKNQINENTTNISNMKKDITNIQTTVNNIDTKIDQKIEGAKITVKGDPTTGVKVKEETDNAGKVKGYEVSLDKKITVGNVTIDGTGEGTDKKGEITGLTNKDWDGENIVSGRAATEDQLQKAMGKVQAQSRTTVTGSKNITVTPKTPNAAEYTVGLANDISVDSVTAKEYKVGDKTYINQDGINANGKKITNVADGTVSADSTDAVNGRQLYAVSQQIEKSAMGNVQKELSEMGDRVNEVQDESREGDAMNAALAALKPLDFDPYNRSQVMAGVSTYKGKQAVAVGLAHYSNEDTLVHAGISYGGSSDLMANAGISWRFGDKEDRDARAKRAERMPQYADGPISSVYVMQDEIATLRAENQSLKEENQEIKRQVEMLMKHAGLNA